MAAAIQNSHGNRKLQHNFQVRSARAAENEDRKSRAGTCALTQKPEEGKHPIEERRVAPGLMSEKTVPVPLHRQNKTKRGGDIRTETEKSWRRWKGKTDQRPQKRNQKRSDLAHPKAESKKRIFD
jgi:hypothetical protein